MFLVELLHLNAKFPSDISSQSFTQLCYYCVVTLLEAH